VGCGPEALLRSSPPVSSSAGPWRARPQHGWCRWWGVLGVWESALRHRHCLEEISGVAVHESMAIQLWLQVWPTAPVCRI